MKPLASTNRSGVRRIDHDLRAARISVSGRFDSIEVEPPYDAMLSRSRSSWAALS